MSPERAHAFVISLYKNILKRTANREEFSHWSGLLQAGSSAADIYYAFVNSQEYKDKSQVAEFFPTGHFHSPVVDPRTVVDYVRKEQLATSPSVSGIELPLDEMIELWQNSSALIAATPFQNEPSGNRRFYYNQIFPYGDAVSLRMMFAHIKPRAVIEIGSGFSSACMLDCADEFQTKTNFTFIDPDPARLKMLLTKNDLQNVKIIEAPVQSTDLAMYSSLERGDILFIDSTHVLKTGSDVHFELFHILPLLKPGVSIHFHDIHFPFEYPDEWIFKDNLSWNEIYALRAFLMYNSDFKVRFWGSCLARERPDLVQQVFPLFLKNPGGSIWMERVR